MQRSVIQLAGKTLVVSLPSAWCKENGIKKGGKVEVDGTTGSLTISSRAKSERQRAIINISNMPSKIAWHYVRAAYIAGVNDIEVVCTTHELFDQTLKRKTSTTAFLHRLSQRFNGVELVQQSKNTFILRDVTTPNPEEFNNAYNRSIHIVRTLYAPPEKSTTQTRADDTMLYEDQLNRLVDFCERMLSTVLHLPSGQTTSYLKILYAMEELGDEAKKCAQEGRFDALDVAADAVTRMASALQSDKPATLLNAYLARAKIRSNPTTMLVKGIIANALNAHQTLLHFQCKIGE
jgi:phosphate uptake regulator